MSAPVAPTAEVTFEDLFKFLCQVRLEKLSVADLIPLRKTANGEYEAERDRWRQVITEAAIYARRAVDDFEREAFQDIDEDGLASVLECLADPLPAHGTERPRRASE